jgi:hypothetical protein
LHEISIATMHCQRHQHLMEVAERQVTVQAQGNSQQQSRQVWSVQALAMKRNVCMP